MNHLRMQLHPQCSKDVTDQVLIEQVVQIISADNLDLGCALIERAVIEKARADIDEQMGPINQRRVSEYRGKWPASLPEALRPQPGTHQLRVYKDFLALTKRGNAQSKPQAAAGPGYRDAPGPGGELERAASEFMAILSSANGWVRNLLASPDLVAQDDAEAYYLLTRCDIHELHSQIQNASKVVKLQDKRLRDEVAVRC